MSCELYAGLTLRVDLQQLQGVTVDPFCENNYSSDASGNLGMFMWRWDLIWSYTSRQQSKLLRIAVRRLCWWQIFIVWVSAVCKFSIILYVVLQSDCRLQLSKVPSQKKSTDRTMKSNWNALPRAILSQSEYIWFSVVRISGTYNIHSIRPVCLWKKVTHIRNPERGLWIMNLEYCIIPHQQIVFAVRIRVESGPDRQKSGPFSALAGAHTVWCNWRVCGTVTLSSVICQSYIGGSRGPSTICTGTHALGIMPQ
jgi:hypothetical protein